MKEETLWSIVGSVAAVGASLMSRQAAEKTYRKVADAEPPDNPERDDVRWRDALLWGAATGVLVGVARVVGRSAGNKALGSAPALAAPSASTRQVDVSRVWLCVWRSGRQTPP